MPPFGPPPPMIISRPIIVILDFGSSPLSRTKNVIYAREDPDLSFSSSPVFDSVSYCCKVIKTLIPAFLLLNVYCTQCSGFIGPVAVILSHTFSNVFCGFNNRQI